MTDPKKVDQELQGTILRLQEKMETSVDRAMELRDRGASEEALLTETAVAVGAAKALENLTGVSWDEALERQAQRQTGTAGTTEMPTAPAAIAGSASPGGRRRRRRLRSGPA